jgi:hypothetical protein
MGLQANELLDAGCRILAGPYHPAFGHLVHCALFLDKACEVLSAAKPRDRNAVFCVHPNSVPKMVGLKKANIEALKRRFGIPAISIRTDPELAEDEVRLG